MGIEIDREGHGRGRITAYDLFESTKTGAVSVKVTLAVDEWWDSEAGEYVDWREFGVFANGDNWVIGADGAVKDDAVKTLVSVAGWDGDLQSVLAKTWQPKPVSFFVGSEEYKGKTRFKASFLRAYEDKPGGGGNVNPNRANELRAKFGPQLRAIAGNVAASKPAPVGKPSAPQAPGARLKPQPRPRPAAPVAAPQEPVSEAAPPQDDIPF